MLTHPYIAFEGPIAAGKTTHAKLLAEKLGSKLLLEDFPENEFLADFYSDKTRWSLPMQLSFLALRYDQLSTVVTPIPKAVVVDYDPATWSQSWFATVAFALADSPQRRECPSPESGGNRESPRPYICRSGIR
jgi:hypothetical protein